jgi:hypothetical protein
VTPCADRHARYAWNAAVFEPPLAGAVVVVPVVVEADAALPLEPPPHPAATTAIPIAPRTAAM